MDARRKIATAASAVTVLALAFEWLAVADSLASDQVEDPGTLRPRRRRRRA